MDLTSGTYLFECPYHFLEQLSRSLEVLQAEQASFPQISQRVSVGFVHQVEPIIPFTHLIRIEIDQRCEQLSSSAIPSPHFGIAFLSPNFTTLSLLSLKSN